MGTREGSKQLMLPLEDYTVPGRPWVDPHYMERLEAVAAQSSLDAGPEVAI